MRWLVALALCLGACGEDEERSSAPAPAEAFVNTYAGTLVWSSACSFGNYAGSAATFWTINRLPDGTLEIADGTCAFTTRRPEGTRAMFVQTTCPTRTTSDGATTRVITGGTLDLNGTALVVSLKNNLTIVLDTGQTGTCSETRAGTLTAQQ